MNVMETSDVKYSALKEKSFSELSSANGILDIGVTGCCSSSSTNSNSPKQPDYELAFSVLNNNSNKNHQNNNEIIVRFDDKSSAVKIAADNADHRQQQLQQQTSPTDKYSFNLDNHQINNYDNIIDSSSIVHNQRERNLFRSFYNLNLKARSRLEKSFLIVNVCLAFILAFFVLYYYARNIKLSNEIRKHNLDNHDACLTDKCILVSGSIFKTLNTKVNPCDDFYEYACGGWIQKNLIPSGFPKWGTLSSITYINQLMLKELLESNVTVPEITEAEAKAKAFYRSCIDKNEVIEKLGSEPLKRLLGTLLTYDNQTGSLVVNQSFEDLLTLIQTNYGLNVYLEISINDDDKNSSYSDIQILQGTLSLDRSFFINNSSDKNVKAIETYKKTNLNVFNMLFDKSPNGTNEKIVDNLLDLEYKLATIMVPSENLSNLETLYKRVKISDLTNKHARFLNWKRFLNSFFIKYNSSIRIKDDDTIIILGLDYFQKLSDLIDTYKGDKEKENTLKLFIVLNFIRFSLPLLSKEYRSQASALGEALTGSITVERWQTCIDHTDNIYGLGYAIARMFIRKVPNNSKSEAEKMIKSIKRSFVNRFPKLPWMDDETRILAEEKVDHVYDLIGYPDFIENDTYLNQRFRPLRTVDDDYFGNEIRLIQFALQFEIKNYRQKVNRLEWDMSPSAVNAYYSPTRNIIVFPSGILQEPFFHTSFPMSLNYGSIGTIMGHELSHGFDDSGRGYDKFGMMHQWWNNKTIENFKNASQCIQDQYSSYKIENENLNGHMTLGENIADNGALKAAYYAYEQWVRENGDEKPLPLLNLTHKQLFFVSFAQTWCTKATADSIHFALSIDQHSPPKFRVIGSVSNSIEFANTFNCPANSSMNPAKKCFIWG